MKTFKLSVLFILLFTIISCGGKGEKKEVPSSKKTTETPKETKPKVDLYSDIEASNDIILTSNDAMKFSKEILKVEGGKKVKITFKHTGKMDKKVMGHNFVLLKKGVSMSSFGNKAASASSNEYIPENTEDVIVHTKLIGGGEETTIEFDAPAAGTYRFICSFPGHYAVMNGKFIVI
ncbi:azurin [Polaribacter sp. IC073]|uniref:azurin n=1 Tax=Polaribacter sp. IC073 TaxID=2508540 RepID=UPI0011BF3D62|nr:azurin [Polaribacter sp. IC073]TXD49881.1 azurin [Polaribacter sp. IC073]